MMQNKHVKMILLLMMAMVASVMFISACSEGFEGESPTNAAPRCFLANIPTEGEEYSYNPILYWYATDTDGFIRLYRYTVKRAEDINDDPLGYAEQVLASGDYSDWTVVYADSLAPGNSATSDTIPLFAEADPEIYTPQYFFVQAVDNHGKPSNFTDTTEGSIMAVAYRMYSRNNNPPETYISFDSARTFFSLEDTTDLYSGVPIAWSGSDSLDYKRTQPPFEYHWRVYGPFEDTMSFDESKFVYESRDTSTNSVWIDNEGANLFNLYRHEPAATTTRSDWFYFEVRSRDDAFVPDPTPAHVWFQVVEPAFENGIMVVDNTSYIGSNCVLAVPVFPFRPRTGEEPPVPKVHSFIRTVFEQAGYPIDSLYWYNSSSPQIKPPPPLDILMSFKLVIFMKENNYDVYNKNLDYLDFVGSYLDLGGMAMFIGWNSFTTFSPGMTPHSPSTFPYKYCDLQASYEQGWSAVDVYKKIGVTYGDTPEEFLRAEAIVPDVPPVLEVDSGDHLRDYFMNRNLWRDEDDSTKTTYPFKAGAEPWVNYFVKGTRSEAVYTAKSVYEAGLVENMDVRDYKKRYNRETIDGKVVGVRNKTDIYRTAVFGFSFYCMYEDQASEFIKAMMDWFFAEDED